MSSSHSAPAFVAHGNWSSETRKHAALRFLELVVKDWFDAQDHANIDYHTEDFSIITPHSEHLATGREHAVSTSAGKFYIEPFKEFKHVPYTLIAIESKDGWDIYAQFNLFANVVGTPVKNEDKVKDEQSKEWDVTIPTFHYFDIVKDPNAKYEGLKLRHIKFIKDTGLVNDILDKRGIKRD